MKARGLINLMLILFFLSIVLASPAAADSRCEGLSQGQTIYVPAYSHIYIGNRERPFLLTVTLSIRNVDPDNQITVTAVDYYETQGKFLRKPISQPKTLQPLESFRYVVPEKDASGGSGANFIVRWKSERPVNSPIVETIMIGARSAQGISFQSRGKVIYNTK